MKRRIVNAVIGFIAGVFVCPLALFACPFIIAWYLYHEEEDDL